MHRRTLNSPQSSRDCWWTTSGELIDNPNRDPSPYRSDCPDHITLRPPRTERSIFRTLRHPPHPPGGCLFNSAEVLETFCGRGSGSMRLAGYPTANSSPEFLERVGNVAPDLFTTCGSEENAECDANADAHEQRCCRAESRTILPGDGPRGSPDAPARGVICVLGFV